MFTYDVSPNRVVCTEAYKRIHKGAVVPASNELYRDVEEWIAEGNSIQPFDGYPKEIGDLRAEKANEINEAFQYELLSGIEYTFPDGTVDVIQTRPQDQVNLTALSLRSTQIVQADINNMNLTFRAASNRTYTLSPVEMMDMTSTAMQFVSDLYQKSWNLKDQIREATEDELKSIIW